MKVILHSGIEIVGDFQHKLSDATSITLLTHYPYVIKNYIDKESSFNGELMSNGAEKSSYRSHAFNLVQKRKRTFARIPLASIKEQK
jgi:hypothetical protein